MTDSFDYLSYARAFGADWTFTKPFALEDLHQAVRWLVYQQKCS